MPATATLAPGTTAEEARHALQVSANFRNPKFRRLERRREICTHMQSHYLYWVFEGQNGEDVSVRLPHEQSKVIDHMLVNGCCTEGPREETTRGRCTLLTNRISLNMVA